MDFISASWFTLNHSSLGFGLGLGISGFYQCELVHTESLKSGVRSVSGSV